MLALMLGGTASAAPLELSHTLRAVDTQGTPIDGEHTVVVSLYSDAGGTDLQWSRSYTPDFDGGYSTIVLQGGTPVLDTALFAGGDVYIGVALDGAGDLLPRQRLLRVPYAGVADAVPTSPSPGASCDSPGQVVYDTTASALRVCDGSSWTSVGTSEPVYANGRVSVGNTSYTAQIHSIAEDTLGDVATLSTSGAFTYTALKKHALTLVLGANSTSTANNSTIRIHVHLQRAGGPVETKTSASTGSYNGDNEVETTFVTVMEPGDVITSSGYNYRGGGTLGYFSILAQP